MIKFLFIVLRVRPEVADFAESVSFDSFPWSAALFRANSSIKIELVIKL
jgi:hypothetical protein